MLGTEASGAVEASGRALNPIATGRNDLDSGAITAVKILCFDLAAMVWGMEGAGYHPRFLMHDSPREADMGPDIYDGLFQAALALEQCYAGKGAPAFQYIITTTTPPPPEMQRGSRWLLEPVLNAATSDERLLGDF
jgi:hypothetical protein